MSFLDTTLGATVPPAKLKIYYETAANQFAVQPIVALFNPASLRYESRAEWRATGAVAQPSAAGFQRMEFQASPPATLTLDLFFDTYEGEPKTAETGIVAALQASLVPDNPFAAGTPSYTDVKDKTKQVAALARVSSELHRPPVCKLQWGQPVLFEGVLSQLREDYTFFAPNGTPVRATLNCVFTAYRTFNQAMTSSELHSADVAKRHVVRRGDTLGGIAALHYGDVEQWRAIARENDIDNPRILAPGQVLVIPKLTS
jgi:nucleoid-associated protein YgaU